MTIKQMVAKVNEYNRIAETVGGKKIELGFRVRCCRKDILGIQEDYDRFLEWMDEEFTRHFVADLLKYRRYDFNKACKIEFSKAWGLYDYVEFYLV